MPTSIFSPAREHCRPGWSRPGSAVPVPPYTPATSADTITVAESLDISPYAIKALVNHTQPRGDVTAGYVALDVERLRSPMQAIGDRLAQAVRGGATVAELPKREQA